MKLIEFSQIRTILMQTVRPLILAFKDLNIFSAVQVGQDVYAADGTTDILPFIAGTNMTIEATQNGIQFSASGSSGSIATAAEIRAAIDAVRT